MASNLPGGVTAVKRIDGVSTNGALQVRVVGNVATSTLSVMTSSDISTIGTPVTASNLSKDGIPAVGRATTSVDGIIAGFVETPNGTAFAETPQTQESGNPLALVSPVDDKTVLQVQTYTTSTLFTIGDVGKYANLRYLSASPRAYVDLTTMTTSAASGAVQIIGVSQVPGNDIPAVSGVGCLLDVVPNPSAA